MTLTAGADVERLDTSARELIRYRNQLQALSDEGLVLMARLGQGWGGQDREDFRGRWHRTATPALHSSAELVGRLATTVLENVRDQRLASGAGDTVGPWGPLAVALAPASAWADNPQHPVWPWSTPTTDRALDLANANGAAVFADDVYALHGKGQLPQGYSRQQTWDDPHSGFRAALYQDGQGHYVLSFAGTEFSSLPDWRSNVRQAVGMGASQYTAAAILARSVTDRYGADHVVFAGHSLGGGLAAMAAIATGAPAYTFNAEGVHPKTERAAMALLPRPDHAGTVHNYATAGDPLTAGQRATAAADARGTTVVVGRPASPAFGTVEAGVSVGTPVGSVHVGVSVDAHQAGEAVGFGLDAKRQHSMAAVRQALQEALARKAGAR